MSLSLKIYNVVHIRYNYLIVSYQLKISYFNQFLLAMISFYEQEILIRAFKKKKWEKEQTTDACNNMLNLKYIKLSERNQTPKAISCMIPFIRYSWKDNTEGSRTEQWLPKPGGKRKVWWGNIWGWGNIWRWWNNLDHDCGGGCMII